MPDFFDYDCLPREDLPEPLGLAFDEISITPYPGSVSAAESETPEPLTQYKVVLAAGRNTKYTRVNGELRNWPSANEIMLCTEDLRTVLVRLRSTYCYRLAQAVYYVTMIDDGYTNYRNLRPEVRTGHPTWQAGVLAVAEETTLRGQLNYEDVKRLVTSHRSPNNEGVLA